MSADCHPPYQAHAALLRNHIEESVILPDATLNLSVLTISQMPKLP